MGFGSVFSFALIALASTADAYLLVCIIPPHARIDNIKQ